MHKIDTKSWDIVSGMCKISALLLIVMMIVSSIPYADSSAAAASEDILEAGDAQADGTQTDDVQTIDPVTNDPELTSVSLLENNEDWVLSDGVDSRPISPEADPDAISFSFDNELLMGDDQSSDKYATLSYNYHFIH